MKVSVALCIGGHDYLPRYYRHTHMKVLTTFIKCDSMRSNLVTVTNKTVSVDENAYIDLIMCLYDHMSNHLSTKTYENTPQKGKTKRRESHNFISNGQIICHPPQDKQQTFAAAGIS